MHKQDIKRRKNEFELAMVADRQRWSCVRSLLAACLRRQRQRGYAGAWWRWPRRAEVVRAWTLGCGAGLEAWKKGSNAAWGGSAAGTIKSTHYSAAGAT
jgi:hypothetical protein